MGAQSRSILWSSMTKIDTEIECWHGTIYITMSDGEVFHLECRRWSVHPVVHALYKFHGKSSHKRNVHLHPEKAKELKRHRQISVVDDGLFLKKPVGWCSCTSHIKFVPWSALISVQLAGNRRSVIVRTAITNELDGQGKKDGATVSKKASGEPQRSLPSEKQLVSAEGGPTEPQEGEVASHHPTQAEKDEELGIIRIVGRPHLSQILFDEMVHMICDCDDDAPDPEKGEIKTKHATANLAKTGIRIDRSSCCGGVEKLFVPWHSLVNIKWQSGSCLTKSSMAVNDHSGCDVEMPGATF